MTEQQILCVLDGWGLSNETRGNAIKAADTPVFDRLLKDNLIATLTASGEAVGLPKGQMGNSEVGHLTIGAGRAIDQDRVRIEAGLARNELEKNETLNQALSYLKKIHVFCLLSDGGVHSHIDHLFKALDYLDRQNIEVLIHVITDGRDTPPNSGINFLEQLQTRIHHRSKQTIVTLGGRFYFMDRDQRWERIECALSAITANHKSQTFDNASEYLKESYSKGVSDEFIKPAYFHQYPGIQKDDGLLMLNFRADRVRQLLGALFFQEYHHIWRPDTLPLKNRGFGMVSYAKELENYLTPLFPRPAVKDTLGQTLAQNGISQIRIAETEKFAHVTYFLNGGHEGVFTGEDRVLIPSPKVQTYDQKPEMSAKEVTEEVLKAIKSAQHEVIIVNYANADMVGHTGDFKATMKACSTLDKCLKQIIEAVDEVDATLFITADHGNADEMLEANSDSPKTAHSKNPVPLIYYKKNYRAFAPPASGTLADIAPTFLAHLNIPIPPSMCGKNHLPSKLAIEETRCLGVE